jgi:hypothetical protein
MMTMTMPKALEIRNNNGLTKDMMLPVVPSVFRNTPHQNVSDQYGFVSTRDVLNRLWKEGFAPVFAAQRATRDSSKRDTTKHIIRLRRRDELGLANPEANEIVIVNSHDTASSFQIMEGFFRMVCSNECIAGDFDNEFRVRHTGNIAESVLENVVEIAGRSVETNRMIGEMKGVLLNRDEKDAFARAALTLKIDDDADLPFTPGKLLAPRRTADFKDDLFTTYQVVQENMVKGGVRHINSAGKRVTTRPIKSIDKDVKINKALWTLAKEMSKLKS